MERLRLCRQPRGPGLPHRAPPCSDSRQLRARRRSRWPGCATPAFPEQAYLGSSARGGLEGLRGRRRESGLRGGATWVTLDRDFARFPGLRWVSPLDAAPEAW